MKLIEMEFAERVREQMAIATHLETENDVEKRKELIDRLVTTSERVGFLANYLKVKETPED